MRLLIIVCKFIKNPEFMKKKVSVGIIGGSGYAGGELLRLLLEHRFSEIKFITSKSFKGYSISSVHPNLRGLIDLRFISVEDISEKVDLIFISLPNGASMDYIDKISPFADKIIDLGADFRLERVQDWEFWYKTKHKRAGLLKKFVYGLPEINREKIKRASFVAGPGCEATVSILALYPLAAEGLIKPFPIIIDAKMSSSQGGKKFSLASHHPERAGCVRSYSPAGHRHTAEIEMVLGAFMRDICIDISATAIDMVRGILITVHSFLQDGVDAKDIWRAYRKHYASERFIRIVKQKTGIYRFPEPKIVMGTNFCDIGFEIDARSRRLVVIAAIDNLTRGTAGQAVQSMNIMFGFDESEGLGFSGLHPV